MSGKPGSTFSPVPGVEIEFVQQKINYGISVIHNKSLRRGLGEYEVEGEKEEAEREPDQLVFVIHGIGERIWSADGIQGMVSLRASVETLRKGTLEQQIKHLEKPSPTRIKPSGRTSSSGANDAISGASGVNSTSSSTITNSSTSTALPPPSPLTTSSSSSSSCLHPDATSSSAAGKCRTEFIPIEWFDAIRKDDEGDKLTKKLQRVSLPSVPLFRQFANDAVSLQ